MVGGVLTHRPDLTKNPCPLEMDLGGGVEPPQQERITQHNVYLFIDKLIVH